MPACRGEPRQKPRPAVAWTILPRKRARGLAHVHLQIDTRALMVIVARAPLRGLAAQRHGRSAARSDRDGQDHAEARSPQRRRCSECNVAGLVRLQRRVGQEVAASLLTVYRREHDLHPTAVAAHWWSDVAKGPRSMPTPRDLHSGRHGRRYSKRRLGGGRSGADRCLPAWVGRARTRPAVAWTIFPRKHARGPAHAHLPIDTRAAMVIVA
jgi:hypothetical protein